MTRPLKVGFLAVDAREFHKDYDTPQPYFGTAPQALLQGFAQLDNVEVHVVSCVRKPVPKTPKIAPNIFFHSLLTPGRWTRTLYTRPILATRRKLGEVHPDIVHGQGAERDCALAAVYSGFPNIITIHGNMREIARITKAPALSFGTIQALFESWAIRRTIGVIALTQYARQQVQSRTPQTWVVPNAVDQKYFDLKWAPGATRDVLCVANVGIRKNQNFLIRSLDPIAEKLGIRLTFLGLADESDSYVKEFLALIRQRPWCNYAGFKRGEELRAYFASTSMVVLPSIEENCSMTVLESMAMGIPVAASRSGGTPDLIESSVNGLLFDPADSKSVRHAISKVLTDEAFAARLAAMGKQRALDRFHPVRIANRHLEVYREALSQMKKPHDAETIMGDQDQ